MAADRNEKMEMTRRVYQAEINNIWSTMNAHHCLIIAGTGEAGKSTFIKQMQMIHTNKFQKKSERLSFTRDIRQSIYRQMNWARKKVESNLKLLRCKKKKEKLVELNSPEEYPFWKLGNENGEEIISYKDDVKFVWKEYRNEKELNFGQYQKTDSVDYFVKDRFDTVCQTDYVPSTNDLLRYRIPTTEMTLHQIEVDRFLSKRRFVFYDLGGQKLQRRQWFDLMQDKQNQRAKFILFFASLADFNEQLEEDETENRLHESVMLFRNLVEHEGNANKHFILILNKMDLFERKLIQEKIKLSDYYENYTEPNDDVKKARKFINNLFTEGYDDKSIYTEFTTATDRNNIKKVFENIIHSQFFDC